MKTPRDLAQAAWEPVGLRVFDTLARRDLRREYRHLLATQWYPPVELHQLQMDALARLLTHAHSYAPFYRDRLRAVGWRPGDAVSRELLQALPPLEKTDLQMQLSEVATVDRWHGGRITRGTTGGSTGARTHFYLDTHTRDRRIAVQYRNQQWLGMPPGAPVAYLGGPSLGVPRTMRLKDQLKAAVKRKLLLSTWDLSDTALAAIAEELRRYAPELLIGYAGALHAFARFLKDHDRTLPLPRVLSTSELLLPQWRAPIERAFEAPLYERYGCEEVGDIAHSCPDCGRMHINDENVIVDVDPVTSELYITDLTTYATPFIRYHLGDRGTVAEADGRCGRGLRVLASFTGRTLDTLEFPSGQRASAFIFTEVLEFVPAVRRYQVWQPAPDRLQLLVVSDAPPPVETIRRRLQPYLGRVTIDVIRVDEIPRTPSGKLRLIMREQSYTGPGERFPGAVA